jgi:hypothetical protein
LNESTGGPVVFWGQAKRIGNVPALAAGESCPQKPDAADRLNRQGPLTL